MTFACRYFFRATIIQAKVSRENVFRANAIEPFSQKQITIFVKNLMNFKIIQKDAEIKRFFKLLKFLWNCVFCDAKTNVYEKGPLFPYVIWNRKHGKQKSLYSFYNTFLRIVSLNLLDTDCLEFFVSRQRFIIAIHA
jgi:hypothetical protein